MHFAAAGGHANVIAELLAHGARVQPDCQGRQPLHLAALVGGVDTTAALLRSSQAEVGHLSRPVEQAAIGLSKACRGLFSATLQQSDLPSPAYAGSSHWQEETQRRLA